MGVECGPSGETWVAPCRVLAIMKPRRINHEPAINQRQNRDPSRRGLANGVCCWLMAVFARSERACTEIPWLTHSSPTTTARFL